MKTEDIGSINCEDFTRAFIRELLIDVNQVADKIECGKVDSAFIRVKAIRSYLEELRDGMEDGD